MKKKVNENIGGRIVVIVAIRVLFFLLRNSLQRKYVGNIIDVDIIALMNFVVRCTSVTFWNMFAGVIRIG